MGSFTVARIETFVLRAPVAEPLAPAGGAPEAPPHLDAPPPPAAAQPTPPAAADDGSRPKIRF